MDGTNLFLLLMMAGLAILQYMTTRSQVANQALASAVNMQSSFNTFSQQIYQEQLKYAEEKGAARAEVQALRDELKAEKERYAGLREQMTTQGVESKATVEQLRVDSQQKIDALQKKIEQLENDMRNVRERLLEAEAEKARLEEERDQLQSDLSGMTATIDSKVREAVDKAVGELRREYESRLAELTRQITAKDDEIQRLQDELKARQGDGNTTTNTQSADTADGGISDSGDARSSTGRNADSGSGGDGDSHTD